LLVLDRADQIWNRACDRACDLDWEPTRPGDRALRDVLQFHGLIRSGGLDYALDCDLEGATRAAAGFRVLQAVPLADLVERAHLVASRAAGDGGEFDIVDLNDDEIDQIGDLGEEYDERLPTDDALERIFRAYPADNPTDFEPI
jgi:hypothetical protein